MSLDRFKIAQGAAHGSFATAIEELRAGRKTSHWIWYVFPQLAGLGRSGTAQHFAIAKLDEACDYLRDPVLGSRLLQAAGVVVEQLARGANLVELMGGTIDSVKVVSSLTLFRCAAQRLVASSANSELTGFVEVCERVLDYAQRQGFPPCAYTLAQCRGA